jgi:hypothetical protein
MGSAYSVICRKCSNTVDEVTYGVSYGMGSSIITCKCNDCNRLFNLSNYIQNESYTLRDLKENFIEEIDKDGNSIINLTSLAKCEKCESFKIEIWNHDCPKCNSKMTHWIETILWD